MRPPPYPISIKTQTREWPWTPLRLAPKDLNQRVTVNTPETSTQRPKPKSTSKIFFTASRGGTGGRRSVLSLVVMDWSTGDSVEHRKCSGAFSLVVMDWTELDNGVKSDERMWGGGQRVRWLWMGCGCAVAVECGRRISDERLSEVSGKQF